MVNFKEYAGGAPSSKRANVKRVVDLIRNPPPPTPSLIGEGVVPKGGVLLLGAEAKVGKTFLLLDACRALATGGRVFEHPQLQVTGSKRVLVVDQELGELSLRDRLIKPMMSALNTDWEDNMYYVSKEPDMLLDSQEGRDLLDDAIAQCSPDVVVLDPIGQLHGYDENNAQQMGALFNTLMRVTRDHDVSLLFSHHFKKPPTGKAAEGFDYLDYNNFRGSGRWTGNPDCILTVHYENHLPKNDDAWKLSMRATTRHCRALKDCVLHVNEFDDWRVRYVPPIVRPEAGRRSATTASRTEEPYRVGNN